ncbi:MAG: PAS domain S-box protein [Polyangiales bacterium]
MFASEDRSEGDTLSADAFRALVDLAMDLVLVADAESGRFLDGNEAACAALGYTRAELLQLHVDDVTSAPRGIPWLERRAQVDGAGGSLRYPSTLRRADGARFPVDVAARRVRLGGRDYVIALIRDTTEREQMVAALRASEERFRLLINEIHVGVMVQGPRAEVLLSNPQARELLGLDEDQLLGRTSFDPSWNVIHQDGTPFSGETHPVPEAIRTRRPQRNVVMGVFRPRRGDRVWLLVDAEPQLDAHGQVESVVCTFSDVTALKEAERALRASEARLREAQRIAGVGSFEWTLGSGALSWSDEMYRIIGTDRSHFVPTDEAVLTMQSPEEGERSMGILQHAVTSGAGTYEWETHLACSDGVTRDIHVRGEILRDEKDTFIGVRGTMQDVTEQKRAARALVESEERYRRAQKLEAIGRLAGGIAHDFNNMLSPILGFASMIRSQLREGDPLREPIEVIEEAGERAAALTKQLLAFSSHRMVQPQAVDLNAVVSRLERMLQRVLGEDIELTTRLATPLGRVLADPSQIEQVILNLAVNARDAMPKGGKLVIETADVTLDERPCVRLSVSDTGTGIDEATRARLFEPFFTTKEPGKGTGLGLATVYAITKQWEGEVRVESSVGHGARFDVDLPRHDAEEVSPTKAAYPLPRGPRHSEKILVVEDDELVRRTTCGILRETGYSVLEASNGADALAEIERNEIQLLITDVVMPGMSGLELVTKARAHRPELAALLLSGYSEEVLHGETALAGSVSFLPKPFKATELLDATRTAIERERTRDTSAGEGNEAGEGRAAR